MEYRACVFKTENSRIMVNINLLSKNVRPSFRSFLCYSVMSFENEDAFIQCHSFSKSSYKNKGYTGSLT